VLREGASTRTDWQGVAWQGEFSLVKRGGGESALLGKTEPFFNFASPPQKKVCGSTKAEKRGYMSVEQGKANLEPKLIDIHPEKRTKT